MWLDALALLVLGAFLAVGALRGGLASGLSLASLILAYGVSVWAGSRFGPAAAQALGSPPWLGSVAAGTAAFALAFVLAAVVSAVLRRRERQRRGDEERSARDRLLGAVFGGLRGAVLVLLVAYLALWLDALRMTGAAPPLPSIEGSAAAELAGSAAQWGVEAALADSGSSGRVAARVAGRPAAALSDLEAVLDDPAIAALRADTSFWTYVENDSVDAALTRASFLRVMGDDALRARLGDLGVVEPEAVADRRRFRDDVADVLRQVGPRLRGLRDDPALRELLQDPEVAAAVQSGDHLALLSNPGFRAVVARVMEGPTDSAAPAAPAGPGS